MILFLSYLPILTKFYLFLVIIFSRDIIYLLIQTFYVTQAKYDIIIQCFSFFLFFSLSQRNLCVIMCQVTDK